MIRQILTDSASLRRRFGAFRLICRRNHGEDGVEPRFAFVISRDVGTAVMRNRLRRRLREAVRLSREAWPRQDSDLVFRIYDDRAAKIPFAELIEQVKTAIESVRQGNSP